jgi:hypothetical protein
MSDRRQIRSATEKIDASKHQTDHPLSVILANFCVASRAVHRRRVAKTSLMSWQPISTGDRRERTTLAHADFFRGMDFIVHSRHVRAEDK